MKSREFWKTRFGFLAALIGGFVGVGNVWRFPYMCGEYGGAAFLIPYLVFLGLLGIIGVTIELTLGKATKGGPITAFEKVGMPKGRYIGFLPVVTLFIIMTYYFVVIGWVLKYFVASFTGVFWVEDMEAYFGAFIFSGYERFVYHALVIAITMCIVLFGVNRGIERSCKIMTPIFFVLLVVLGITSSMLPGAWKGLAFYLSPDLSKLTPTTWLMALGQIFFSIGLASAIIVLYGSYMRDKEDVPANSVVASVGDTLVALIAGFAIFPAVFAMGLPPASGPGLVFVIYPMVLAKMPAGVVFAPLFFLAFLFITLTSAIALLEFVVEPLVYRLGWSRRRSVITMGLILWLAGLPACYNFMWLASVDMYLTTILLPICALIAPIALFWFYGSEQALAWANKGASFKLGKWWLYWGKYLYPLIIIIVLVWGIYSTFLAG